MENRFKKIFNPPVRPIFGLDLSDLSLKIIQLNPSSDGLTVTGCTESIPKGIVKGGEIKKIGELSQILRQTIDSAKGKHLRGKRVVCNLPEEKVFVRIIQMPRMSESEVGKAVRWEAEAYIPLSIEEVYLSWQTLGKSSSKANHTDVLIAAAPRYLVDSYVRFLKESGLDPVALEPESIAITRCLTTKDQKDALIIVDFGLNGTSFVVYADSAIRFTSHVQIAGRSLHEAIMKELKVTEKEALKMKIEIGLLNRKSKEKKIYEALMPIVKEMADQISEYSVFCDLNGGESKKKVVLCGGDSLLFNLPEEIQKLTGFETVLGNPAIRLGTGSSGQINRFMKENKALSYATAIGLALREIENDIFD